MNFFKKKVDPKEAARSAKKETKSQVRQSQREIEREMRDLDRQEGQVMAEIKRRAKAPGVNPASDTALKTLAKQLVQIRNHKQKMLGAKAHLGAVGMQASSMASQVTAAAAIGSVTTAMSTANKAVDSKEVAKTMAEFSKQTEVMNLREEMMDDALTDAFDNDEIEEEADQVTNQVLTELGIEMDAKFTGLTAPSNRPKISEEDKEAEDALAAALPDLKARLDAL